MQHFKAREATRANALSLYERYLAFASSRCIIPQGLQKPIPPELSKVGLARSIAHFSLVDSQGFAAAHSVFARRQPADPVLCQQLRLLSWFGRRRRCIGRLQGADPLATIALPSQFCLAWSCVAALHFVYPVRCATGLFGRANALWTAMEQQITVVLQFISCLTSTCSTASDATT